MAMIQPIESKPTAAAQLPKTRQPTRKGNWVADATRPVVARTIAAATLRGASDRQRYVEATRHAALNVYDGESDMAEDTLEQIIERLVQAWRDAEMTVGTFKAPRCKRLVRTSPSAPASGRAE